MPAIEYDLHGFRARKHRQPFHDGAGHKVRFISFGDNVTASAHDYSRVVDAERLWLHSHAERGNDEEGIYCSYIVPTLRVGMQPVTLCVT
jgi:hypothetical protein